MIGTFVARFAWGMKAADARRPQAANLRSGYQFQPGIGPHSEDATVRLVMNELGFANTATGVAYPEGNRQRCDLCFGREAPFDWAVEFKMLRFLGDNGKENDNVLMHILSPYASHNSALSDCTKLATSHIARRKAVVIFGYEASIISLQPAIGAFEVLASRVVTLGPRHYAREEGLVHPVHSVACVFGWEVRPLPE